MGQFDFLNPRVRPEEEENGSPGGGQFDFQNPTTAYPGGEQGTPGEGRFDFQNPVGLEIPQPEPQPEPLESDFPQDWEPGRVMLEEEPEFSSWMAGLPNVQHLAGELSGSRGREVSPTRAGQELFKEGLYDYPGAWRAGVQPQGGQMPLVTPEGQWLQSPQHPEAWKLAFRQRTGQDPDQLGLSDINQANAYLFNEMTRPAEELTVEEPQQDPDGFDQMKARIMQQNDPLSRVNQFIDREEPLFGMTSPEAMRPVRPPHPRMQGAESTLPTGLGTQDPLGARMAAQGVVPTPPPTEMEPITPGARAAENFIPSALNILPGLAQMGGRAARGVGRLATGNVQGAEEDLLRTYEDTVHLLTEFARKPAQGIHGLRQLMPFLPEDHLDRFLEKHGWDWKTFQEEFPDDPAGALLMMIPVPKLAAKIPGKVRGRLRLKGAAKERVAVEEKPAAPPPLEKVADRDIGARKEALERRAEPRGSESLTVLKDELYNRWRDEASPLSFEEWSERALKNDQDLVTQGQVKELRERQSVESELGDVAQEQARRINLEERQRFNERQSELKAGLAPEQYSAFESELAAWNRGEAERGVTRPMILEKYEKDLKPAEKPKGRKPEADLPETADPQAIRNYISTHDGIRVEAEFTEGMAKTLREQTKDKRVVSEKGANIEEWAERLSEEGHPFRSKEEAFTWLKNELTMTEDVVRVERAQKRKPRETDSEYYGRLEIEELHRSQEIHADAWGLVAEGKNPKQVMAGIRRRKEKRYEPSAIEDGDIFYIGEKAGGDVPIDPGLYRVKRNKAKRRWELVDGDRYTLPVNEGITGVKVGVIDPAKLPRAPIRLKKAPPKPAERKGPPDDVEPPFMPKDRGLFDEGETDSLKAGAKKLTEAETKLERDRKRKLAAAEKGQSDLFDQTATERARGRKEDRKAEEAQGELIDIDPDEAPRQLGEGEPGARVPDKIPTKKRLRKYQKRGTEDEGIPLRERVERAMEGVRRVLARQPRRKKLPGKMPRPAEMVRKLEQAAYSVRRIGRITKRTAAGQHEPFHRVIRLKVAFAENLSVMAHEMGHALQNVMFPEIKSEMFDYTGPNKKLIRAEMKALGEALYGKRKTGSGLMSEGWAEFIRQYVEDRPGAQKNAPAMYKEFIRRLLRDEHTIKAAEIMDSVAADWARWRDMPVVARLRSRMSVGENRRHGGSWSQRWGNLMTRVVSDRYWMEKYIRDVNGGKLRHSGMNPLTSATLHAGRVGGRAELGLTHGIVDIKENKLVSWLADRDVLTDEGVVKGEKAIWEAPRGKGRKISSRVDSDVEVIARRLEWEFIHKRNNQQLPPLLEARPKGKTKYTKRLYLTEAGKESLSKHQFKPQTRGLQDMLSEVAEPSKFTVSIAKDNSLSRVGKAFSNLISGDRAANYDNFRVYVTAKHLLWLSEKRGIKGLNFTRAELLEAVDTLKSEKFDRVSDELYDFQAKALHWLVDEGVISEKEFKIYRRSNPYYVPLHRVLEGDVVGGGVRGKGVRVGKPHKRIRGADMELIDPLESIVKNLYLVSSVVSRNQMRRALHEWGEAHPGTGWMVKEVSPKKTAVGLNLQELRKEFETSIRNTFEEMGDASGEMADTLIGEMRERNTLDIRARVWRLNKDISPNEKIVSYMKGGEEVLLEIDSGLHDYFAGMDQRTTSLVVSALGLPARTLRAGATLHPDFFLKNLIRDAISASMFAEHGFIPGVDTVRGLASMWKAAQKYDADYVEWKASGGAFATMVSFDRNYLQHNLRKVMADKSLQGLVKTRAMHPIEALRDMSEILENSTRLGVFKRAKRAFNRPEAKQGIWEGLKRQVKMEKAEDSWVVEGGTQDAILRAAVESREASLDFAHAGTLAREYNKISAFLNANIRGIDKFGRVVLRDLSDPRRRNRFAVGLASVVIAPTIAEWLLNMGNEEYDGLSDYQKDLYWNFPVPGKPGFIAIPKPHEAGLLFGSLLGRGLRVAFQSAPADENSAPWADALRDAFIPQFMPTALGALVENFGNRRLWGGTPIEPRREVDLDARLRYGPYTSDVSKLAAAAARAPAVKKLSGVLRIDPRSGEDVSPRNIDHIIRSWSGGLGSRWIVPGIDKLIVVPVTQLVAPDLAKDLGIGKRAEGTRTFVDQAFGSFMVKEDELGRGTIDRFYKRLEKSRRARNTWRKIEDIEDAKRYWREHRQVIAERQSLEDANRVLSTLHARFRKITFEASREDRLLMHKQIVKAAQMGTDQAGEIQLDETTDEAVWVDWHEGMAKADEEYQRNGWRLELQEVVREARELKSRGPIEEYLGKLPPDQKDWANGYVKRLQKETGQTMLEDNLSKVPKKRRERIRLKAAESVRE